MPGKTLNPPPDWQLLSKQINVRVHERLWEKFNRKCLGMDIKHSTVIRKLLSDFVHDKGLKTRQDVLGYTKQTEREPNDRREEKDGNID